MRIDNLQDEITGLKELVHEAREEHTAMEQTLMMQLAANSPSVGDHNWRIDLEGKRVLYVGGRVKLTPHLRSLVESHNGRFEHHDGGLEDSRAGLHCNSRQNSLSLCAAPVFPPLRPVYNSFPSRPARVLIPWQTANRD
jgi:hypothetical protein